MTCKKSFSIAFLCLTFSASHLFADGFSTKTAPTLTPSKAANMECRYFTELLGIASAKSLAAQFDPIENTQVDTIVCCPMGWRFYNYPSQVDLTWKEPNKHPRDLQLYAGWKKMVDNLAAGGDPLKDALKLARKQKKRFIVSFRMNDNHYVHKEQFPTHNNFWRDHPEYRLGKDSGTRHVLGSMSVFNYSVPQVRDFYFAVLEEICTNYDVDGVELDFQRAPRFFHDNELDAGRAIMTAHVKRIREMLDKAGQSRGRRLQLGARVLPSVQANYDVGLDVLAWDAAGHLDSITVSSSYVQTADVGIEGFVARRKNAKIFGELNYLHVQIAGTGHDSNDRRYVTPETYRAATLSFLERGVDGVSFFNTYCVPRPELKKLLSDLLTHFKDLDTLKRSDKLYTCYATPATMFGRVFPARNEKSFEMFIADELPGRCKNAILRFETKASCKDIRVEAWLNGTKLDAHTPDAVELFPPVSINKASPNPENLKYFSAPLSALKFGINAVTVKKTDNTRQPCNFTAAELALYMNRAN
ncbi:MAG: family 10 glycosylhydrolase [Verrucomicrobiia bacterium]